MDRGADISQIYTVVLRRVMLFVTYYLCGMIKRVQTLRGFFIYDFTLSVRTLPTFEACVFIM